MSGEILILIGGEGPRMPMEWVRLGADGTVRARGRTDAGGVEAAAKTRTILILPGTDAHVKALTIDARTQTQARAAAPYLFEGAFAATEDSHYALGAVQAETGRRLVAGMSAARLSAWLDACRAFGAAPTEAYLDFTLWPVAPGEAHVIDMAGLTLVAAGASGGYAIERALAPALFPRWLEQVGGVRGALLSVRDQAPWLGALAPGQARAAPLDDAVLAAARAAAQAPAWAPNLLQGDFAPASQRGARFRFWRLAASLAILALFLQIGILAVEGMRDQRSAAQILALAERDFRAARPNVERIVNLRAQVTAISNASVQAGRHPVLTVSEPVIRMLQAAPLVRLEEVRHAAPGRIVHVRLSAPQAAALESAADFLRGDGLSVASRALLPTDGRFIVELAVESP